MDLIKFYKLDLILSLKHALVIILMLKNYYKNFLILLLPMIIGLYLFLLLIMWSQASFLLILMVTLLQTKLIIKIICKEHNPESVVLAINLKCFNYICR